MKTYEELGAALKASGIPFAECEWATRPTGTFGTWQADMEVNQDDGDDMKLARETEGSIDLYISGGRNKTMMHTVERILIDCCEGEWRREEPGYERETRLYHVEWIFRLPEEMPGPAGTETNGTDEG